MISSGIRSSVCSQGSFAVKHEHFHKISRKTRWNFHCDSSEFRKFRLKKWNSEKNLLHNQSFLVQNVYKQSNKKRANGKASSLLPSLTRPSVFYQLFVRLFLFAHGSEWELYMAETMNHVCLQVSPEKSHVTPLQCSTKEQHTYRKWKVAYIVVSLFAFQSFANDLSIKSIEWLSID